MAKLMSYKKLKSSHYTQKLKPTTEHVSCYFSNREFGGELEEPNQHSLRPPQIDLQQGWRET